MLRSEALASILLQLARVQPQQAFDKILELVKENRKLKAELKRIKKITNKCAYCDQAIHGE